MVRPPQAAQRLLSGTGRTSVIPSIAGKNPLQVLVKRQQTFQIVRRGKDVHIAERSSHSSSDWSIVLHPQERIEPQDALRPALSKAHLFRQELRIASVPAIAEN